MKIAFPSDNKPLSQAEFDHCCALIEYYAHEEKQILPYCRAHGREPELYDRGNCWQQNFVDYLVGMLLSKKYNNVNRLRLIGFHFSAYRVFDLTWVTEAASNEWFHNFYTNGVPELPEDVDSVIKSAIDPKQRIESLFHDLGDLVDRIDNKYLHGQPLRFGEVAGEYRGYMFNGDSLRYWKTMAVLSRTGILKQLERKIARQGVCRVMEIGAGYGGLAYQLKKTYGEKLQFVAVDLVESLIFSSCYLTTVLGGKSLRYTNEKTIERSYGLVFVPSFRSPEFFKVTHDVDLCINTISMNEMSTAQVEYYAGEIAKALSPDGVFFECNCPSSTAGAGRIDVKSRIAPHFNHRLSVGNTEVVGDGALDLWSNALPSDIQSACIQEYRAPEMQYKRASPLNKLLGVVQRIRRSA
jgi:putative sugar O-methyltransferase